MVTLKGFASRPALMRNLMKVLGRIWVFATIILLLLLLAEYTHRNLIQTATGTQSPQKGDYLVLDSSDTTAFLGDIRLLEASEAPKGVYSRPMEVWLDNLRDMENCPEQGIWDVHSLSFGPYCFKKDTFERYMAIYGKEVMPNAEPGEYLNNLSDYRTQRELTRLIIANEPNGHRNWHTSIFVRGLGVSPI